MQSSICQSQIRHYIRRELSFLPSCLVLISMWESFYYLYAMQIKHSYNTDVAIFVKVNNYRDTFYFTNFLAQSLDTN